MLTNLDVILDLLYGGAKGGGKSYMFCLWVDRWVEFLIGFFDLWNNPPKEPIPVGFIGRKQSIDFKNTTLETFKRFVPADHYRLKKGDQEIIFRDRLKVFYGGLDDQERIKKFNSMEIAFFGIDQAEETERTDVDVLKAACRLIINGKQPPYKRLYTANPADCWLKEDFIDNKLANHYYVPALYTDNPYLPDNYGTVLEDAFRHNEPMLRAYKFGDWFALQATNSLISSKMLADLKGVTHYPKETRRVIACDPSLGGDECPIYCIENGKIIDEKILHERDQMKIAGEMMVMGQLKKCPNYTADCTGGLGTAILDRIREIDDKYHCYYVNASEKSALEERFANVKAEMSWFVMTLIQDKLIPYPEDEELRSQLTNQRFKVVGSNGRIQMEPKDKVKLRIGRSPDRCDAYNIGQYVLPQTEPIRIKDRWRDVQDFGEIGSATESAMAA